MLRVILLGSGGATPYATRTTPMVAAVAAGRPLLFDCGSGATLRLAQAQIDAAALDALFITHFHADHCVDFPLVVLASYLGGRTAPLPIYGPGGITDFVATMMDTLFPYIPRLVKSAVGAQVLLSVTALEPGSVVEGPGWIVTAGRARHTAPALCYRLQTSDGVLAMSGDSEPSDDVVALAAHADLLIHECAFTDARGFVRGHTLPHQLGPIAARAGARCLVLTHLFEETLGHEEEMVAAIKGTFGGDVVVGTDLLEIQLCAGGAMRIAGHAASQRAAPERE